MVSLEPAPREFRSLRRNIALNRLDQVNAYPCAAWESDGEVSFMYEPGHPTQGKLADVERTYQVAGAVPIVVRGLALDGLLDSANSHMLRTESDRSGK